MGRLGDDSYSSYEGGGDSSSYFNSEPSGTYGGETTYVTPPSYDQSTSSQPANQVDPYAGMDLTNLGVMFEAQGTSTMPTSNPNQSTSLIEGPSFSWLDALSSPSNLMAAINPSTSSQSTSTGVSKVAQPVKKTSPSKGAMPAKSTSKPSKVNNKPNVDAYEALFKANLASFLASSMSDSDKTMGENYFTSEWSIFASDMNGAGSWGTQGLADRNRGGKFDWWAKYYDPIAGATSTGSGFSLTSSLGSDTIIPLLLFGVGLLIIWKMTE
jgi:hypothetical protein